MGNIKFVDNTDSPYTLKYRAMLSIVYETRELPEDFEDIFKISFIPGLNQDGTDRMIIEMA